jgi:hypothetical protein
VLFAAMLGFHRREFFRAEGAEAAPVRVQF